MGGGGDRQRTPQLSRREGPPGLQAALLPAGGLTQAPLLLGRRRVDVTLRAGRRLPLDRKGMSKTLWLGVRRDRVCCAAPGAMSPLMRSVVSWPEVCRGWIRVATGGLPRMKA